jgi:hypothetical protein
MADQIATLVELQTREPAYADRLRGAASARFSSPRYIEYFRELIAEPPAPGPGTRVAGERGEPRRNA